MRPTHPRGRLIMVFVVGVFAALLLGLGYVLQQRVAAQAPLEEMLKLRLLLDLMHKPMWWAGIGAMAAGQVLSGLALEMASVAVVEPLLSTGLLFALGFAAVMCHVRLHWHEVVGAALLTASLAVFLAVGNPHSSPAPETHNSVIVLAVAVVIGVVALLIVIGKARGRDGRPAGLVRESVLLATGAGLLYGLQDASTRAALVVNKHHGVLAMLASPWSWVIVGSAAIGILLSQSAFKAARLDYSLPPITAAEPIAGIALGLSLLGDTVSVTIPGLAVESACLVAMVVGVALIGRSPNLAAAGVAPVSPALAGRADPQ